MTSLPLLALLVSSYPGQTASVSVPAIQFADSPTTLYVPAHTMAAFCGMPLTSENGGLDLGQKPLPDIRQLFDGTKLFALRDMSAVGASIAWDQTTGIAAVTLGTKTIMVKLGPKRVEVNKVQQQLRAYQGDILILQTHVSTGRKGHRTPSGAFEAHGKERMHYSKLYDDAPMPWAVQVDGNVFIHGYPSVPRYPASHGCIRVPLYGKNPARYFYHWVSIGTPVTVEDSWVSGETPVAHKEPAQTPMPTAKNAAYRRP